MKDASARWRALDDLRGLTILFMVPVNAMMDFVHDPPWFNHAPGPGLNFADCILPTFLFAMGVSASFSLERRARERGQSRTLFHGLARYALLFVFGTIGYFLVWKQGNWEVLQLLGAAGGFAFLFMFLPPRWRLAAAAGILLASEALRPGFLDAQLRSWYASGIGGPWGFLPFSVIPLAASCLGEELTAADTTRRVRLCLGVGLASLAEGLAWAAAFGPPDKHLASTAYLLITFGLASSALGLLSALESHLSLPPLTALGRNSLLMYMLSGVLILPLRAWADQGIPEPGVWGWGAAVLALSGAVAWTLDRKGCYVKL